MTSSIMETRGLGRLQCGGSDLSYRMRCQHAHRLSKTMLGIFGTVYIVVSISVELMGVQVHVYNYYHIGFCRK